MGPLAVLRKARALARKHHRRRTGLALLAAAATVPSSSPRPPWPRLIKARLSRPALNVPRTPAMELACGTQGLPVPGRSGAGHRPGPGRPRAFGALDLPATYDSLTVPEQVFLLADLERVDRGLPRLYRPVLVARPARPQGCRLEQRPQRARRSDLGLRLGRGAKDQHSWPTTTGCTTTVPGRPTWTARARLSAAAGTTGATSWETTGRTRQWARQRLWSTVSPR